MTIKKLLTAVSLLCLSLAIGFAQGPNGSNTYYQAANGKKGAALKTALHNRIKISSAGWSYDGLKEAYKKTDTRADGYLRDWYSNATSYTPGSDCAGSYKVEGDGYNREHLVPQSWFEKASPMKSDIWHVVPSDAKINGERGDKPLGEVGSSYTQSTNGYSKWGMARSGLGYTGQVFEPNDEVKGDIARAYFYMVTCYQDKISSWNATNATYVFDGNTYPGLTDWCLTMMMRWSALDPVDDIEIARNNVIAAKQNRNPFVDYPGLEDYIWGDKKTVAFSYDNYDGSSTGKQFVTMSFSPDSVSVVLGDDYTAPTLTTSPSGLTVTYSSSNTSVATVNASTGAITIKAVGTTTITASFAGNDDYYANSASYTLTVTKQGGGDEPTPSGNGSFTKVTSASQLVAGYEYILVAETSKKVMNSTAKSTYFEGSDVKISNNTIAYDESMLVLKLGGSSGAWTFQNGSNYLVSTGAKKVSLSTSSAAWTISTDFTATPKTSSYGTLQYNAASPRFTTYTSAQEKAVLYYRIPKATLLGDVNGDGEVTIADVTALVNILLGKDTAGYNLEAADVNSDGGRTIADVTVLVNILLGKK